MSSTVKYIHNPHGFPGVLAKCQCGWSDYWGTMDGSAQASGASHECGKPSTVPPRPLPKKQSEPAVKYPDDHEPDSCTCFLGYPPCGYCEHGWTEEEEI